ncbi:MAG: Ig-like domain-containing protein [Paludibacteraceae bacterium]|nr:Ig-like domain-containing protein [Paludibacteraceae bacterium]
MRRFIRLFLAMFLAVISTGCGKKAVVSDDTQFMEYISSYPQNRISRHAAIRIVLTHPSDKAKPGQKEEEKLFSMDPKVEGSTFWVDNRTLEFQPETALERGKEYQVTFELGKVADLDGRDELKQFVFPVEVIKQNMYVSCDEPQMMDGGEYQVTGTVSLNDKEELADLQGCFTARMTSPERKTLDMEWSDLSSDYNHNYSFTITGFGKSIKKDISLEVEWNGKSIDCDAKDKIEINIPYIAGMKVTNLSVVNGEQSYLKLFFSKSIRPNQEWRTYVNVGGGNVSYVREGNVLKIYPEKINFSESQLHVYSGLMSEDGEKVERDTVLSYRFSSLKPAVRLLKNGVILPSTDKAALPFQAVNLKSVDVTVVKIFENNMLYYLQSNKMNECNYSALKRTARLLFQKRVDLEADNVNAYSQWRTYSLDLSQLAKEDPGAMYHVIFSFKRAYSTYPCEITDSINDIDHDYSGVAGIEDNGDDSYYWSYYTYDDDESAVPNDYAYRWRERDDPSKISYYMESSRRVQSNIFVSNFGITAKGGKSNFYDVIVTNILTAMPESGANVKFYDYQMQLISEEETDKDGFVKAKLSRSPTFVVVEKDGRMGYLRMRDNSALSLSSFDVGGAKSSKGVKGYIYGERGVWRPGDTLNISLMLQDADGTLPAGHPITMYLKTPRGQRYAQKVQKYDPSNCIYSFRIPTQVDDQTGNWHIGFTIGGSTFQKSLSVETVKPNRMKVQLSTKHPVLSSGTSEPVSIHSEWLHGGRAAGKNVNVTMRYRRNPNPFPKYSDYIFESPSAKDFTSQETTVIENETDDEGNVTETIHIPELTGAPGLLQATFTTRVDEGTGDNSVNYTNVPLSTYSRYVGVKYPIKPGFKYVFTNKDQTFPIVLLDENGNPVNGEGISLKLYRLNWHWWWDSDEDEEEGYYSESRSTAPYWEKKDISVKDGRALVTINVPDRDWGRYLLVVKDGKKGHEAGGEIFFDWENWYSRAQNDGSKAAAVLSFTLDKETYNVGDKVKVTIPTPEKGRVLITVENRSRVLSSKWVDAQAGTTVVDVDVTDEMMPNAYLYVNLLQPYNKTENDLPIRMYGVKNFMVESEQSHLYPVIKMADKVESDKAFDVTVSEKNGKEMNYTLAIVDEGLLDLTNFKTPNAHNEFFKREALGVNSWDMYDLVIGAYGGKIEQMLAIGGDEALNRDGMNKRFEPVVRFYGPITLKKGESKTHKVVLPTYFGSVRVMVVAGNKSAYGSAEKAVKVTKPLMLLPTAPRVVGPNEEFSLPVSVFAMDGKKKNVTISVSAGDKAEVVGKSTIQESFNENEDKIITFKLKAKPIVGTNKITISASDGTNNVKSEINLSVRNPNERIQKSKMFEIPANQEVECPYDLFGVENTNQLMVEISSLPALDLGRSLEYLIGYPHGCAEQTSSKAFPQLLLPEIIEMTPEEKKECDQHVKEAVLKLSQMQMGSGAFSYWMGGNYDYPWVTTYAGHFLLEAKNHGYDVSNTVINNFLAYQKRMASSWSYRSDSDNMLEQAYRLYTLALAGKADLSAMNRLKDKQLDNVSQWRLAAAYALCGKKDVAKNLCASLSPEVRKYSYSNVTFGSTLRDRALILDAMTLIGSDKAATFSLLRKMSEQLGNGKQYSTQELAQVLVAFSHYAKQFKGGNINAACIKDGKSVAFNSNNNVVKKSLEVSGTGQKTLKIKNNGGTALFASVVTSGIPLENAGGSFENGLSMKVTYSTLDGSSIDVNKLEQGTDFQVRVKVSNSSSYETYKEVALTQVFPSGWEIQNERLSGSSDESENYNYRDFRDDRVLTYFSLAPRETKTFTVKLHASFVGRYFAPGFLCSSMYDSEISARNIGFWTVVSE